MGSDDKKDAEAGGAVESLLVSPSTAADVITSYTRHAIFAALSCCFFWPLAIPAVYYASKASSYSRTDAGKATRLGRRSCVFSIVATVLGIIIIVVLFLIDPSLIIHYPASWGGSTGGVGQPINTTTPIMDMTDHTTH
jgi:hypothetical protein